MKGGTFPESPWWVFWLNDSEETNHLVFCEKSSEHFGLKAVNNKQTNNNNTGLFLYWDPTPHHSQFSFVTESVDRVEEMSYLDQLLLTSSFYWLLIVMTQEEGEAWPSWVSSGVCWCKCLSALYNNANLFCSTGEISCRETNRLSYVTLLSVGLQTRLAGGVLWAQTITLGIVYRALSITGRGVCHCCRQTAGRLQTIM